ncbi:NADH dehydrogenase subunit H [Rickettsia akari str. Hartford]|uniref:NADH dehydrogenase subunit H n=1 Tax=Rickettsia akari (strain Hartford) TaxID=293614 RepID=A8GPY6_RICAH|nr:NADH dehydrogenase subunit H [Rickettsia akari str. Hartford]
MKKAMLALDFKGEHALRRYESGEERCIAKKVFLPLTLFWVVLVSSVLFYTDNLPNV